MYCKGGVYPLPLPEVSQFLAGGDKPPLKHRDLQPAPTLQNVLLLAFTMSWSLHVGLLGIAFLQRRKYLLNKENKSIEDPAMREGTGFTYAPQIPLDPPLQRGKILCCPLQKGETQPAFRKGERPSPPLSKRGVRGDLYTIMA